MNILLYGANGWIGQNFIKYLDNCGINYIKGSSRVDNPDSVKEEILNYRPTHVFCLIGRTSGDNIPTIDYLEQPGMLNINLRDNLYAPLVLAVHCKNIGCHLTYIGSGCIFHYQNIDKCLESFGENDLPNFFGSSYSTVKGYTDRLLHLFEDTILNIRIRMPITAEKHPRNFITKITNYKNICSISNSMTVLDDFYSIWIDLMQKHAVGTYNCTNPGVISHNEILEMYRELVNPYYTWINFSINDQRKLLAAERSNCCLNTDKISKLYPELPDIKTSVRKILQNYLEKI